jgi:hypothetical protein
MFVLNNMANCKSAKKFFAFLIIAVSCWPMDSYAYLDPGTGSLMLQAIVAGIFAGLFAVKRYIFMIIAFLKRPFQKRGTASQDSNTDDRAS